MKKVLVLVLVALFTLSTVAVAEVDLSQMTDEELYALRLSINEELGSRIHGQYEIADGTTLAELFPDTWLAKYIRDKIGLFSTKDVVTQEQLDKITWLRIDGQTTDHVQVSSIEGIQYLRNLEHLEVNKQESITEIPEWVGSLTHLDYLEFRYCPVTIVPDCICNLTNLEELNFYGSDIEALPKDIGNLFNLEEIDIGHTRITELPESIYNLSLKKFNREGLDID